MRRRRISTRMRSQNLSIHVPSFRRLFLILSIRASTLPACFYYVVSVTETDKESKLLRSHRPVSFGDFARNRFGVNHRSRQANVYSVGLGVNLERQSHPVSAGDSSPITTGISSVKFSATRPLSQQRSWECVNCGCEAGEKIKHPAE